MSTTVESSNSGLPETIYERPQDFVDSSAPLEGAGELEGQEPTFKQVLEQGGIDYDASVEADALMPHEQPAAELADAVSAAHDIATSAYEIDQRLAPGVDMRAATEHGPELTARTGDVVANPDWVRFDAMTPEQRLEREIGESIGGMSSVLAATRDAEAQSGHKHLIRNAGNN